MKRLITGYTAFIVLLLLAGCTAVPDAVPGAGGGEGSPAEGLSISFQQLGSYAEETGTATLQLRVENQGQGAARNINADLFGPGFVSGTASIDQLQGVDRAAGQSGETAIREWTLSSLPDLDPGRRRTYSAHVRVRYDYTTTATLPVTLSQESYAPENTSVRVSNIAAPVQFRSRVSSPIATGASTTHSVPVSIENRGSGELASPVSVTATLTDAPGGVSIDCGGNPVTVSLTDEAVLTCQLQTPGGGVPFETQLSIRLAATYTYQQEAETTLTVRGVQ
ncbi:MAG: hypothetical protein SVW77_01540 [Candidatus Nanohaloarchaea archaeon]|nr:hypothetical protein [Candidatus Nanohaloarchaea archaeon]